MTYDDFMSRVDALISARTDGLDHSDFADAPWRDLHRETGGEASGTQIISCLETADSLFLAMMQVGRGERQAPETMQDYIDSQISAYDKGKQGA